jgi:hypothetical protein
MKEEIFLKESNCVERNESNSIKPPTVYSPVELMGLVIQYVHAACAGFVKQANYELNTLFQNHEKLRNAKVVSRYDSIEMTMKKSQS